MGKGFPSFILSFFSSFKMESSVSTDDQVELFNFKTLEKGNKGLSVTRAVTLLRDLNTSQSS